MNNAIFKRLAVSDNGFVFDPQTGHSYIVNETGLEMLNCLKKEMPENAILRQIMDNYEVMEEQIERDYTAFLIKLKQYGLVKDEFKKQKNIK